jgi:hypothetical protein
VVWIKRSSDLDVLNEDAILALGIDHTDRGAARARPRGFVDQLEAMTRSLRQSGSDVIDPQRKVVQPLTPPGDETPDVGLWSEWFKQLNARRPCAEEGDANLWKALVALQVEAEAGLEMWTGGVDGTDGPTEVVDGRHASGLGQ